ncbi:MAG TPA: alpha/beta hydrolase-fold protein [Candidatus Xenobia bacterium]|jgi:enterochelin esterase family protein
MVVDAWQNILGELKHTPVHEREARLQQALHDLHSPVVGSDAAVFLYQGREASVALTGDMTGWLSTWPMHRVEGTTLWYIERHFERDARLDYKFVVDDTWIMDPRNPRVVLGGFGSNSELMMPGYPSHPETLFDASIPAGSLMDESLYSHALGQERPYHVYRPTACPLPCPVVYFQDGSDYLNAGHAAHVLDYMMAHGRIPPVMAVFVDCPDRSRRAHDYANNPYFVDFFVNELMPVVEPPGEVSRRVLVGDSMGGLACGYLAYRHPNLFTHILSHSGAFPPAYGEPLNIAGLPPEDPFPWARNLPDIAFATDLYLVVGTYEHNVAGADFLEISQRVARDLARNPRTRRLHLAEVHQGHSWGLWRDTLGEGLEFLLG